MSNADTRDPSPPDAAVLSELAPDLIEPGGTKSYAELWGEFNLSSQIIRVVE